MLGLGNSVGGYVLSGAWLPSDEGSLFAWWKFNTGITLNGSNVNTWADSSSNSHDMTMSNGQAAFQPAFSSGVLTFAVDGSSNPDHLVSSTNIELDGEFVLGFKINPSSANNVVLASITTGSEMFKIFESADRLRVKNDSATKDFTLSSGSILDDAYYVVSRDGSDNVTVFKDGSAVGAAQSVAGTFDINALGLRQSASAPGTNPYIGTMKEVVIFKGTTSTALINNVSSRLSGL